MTNERVVEIPWALTELPQVGDILDVGSCDASYLAVVHQPGRTLHCLDPRERPQAMPPGAVFHRQNLIGNQLPRHFFDAVLLVSTLEHIGLPAYGLAPFPRGDERAMAEVAPLLKAGAPAILTVPAGQSKITSQYRQYCPGDLGRLLAAWHWRARYWGFDGRVYVPITEAEVELYDYRDARDGILGGAGAVAGVVAYSAAPPPPGSSGGL